MSIHKEINFEDEICQQLGANGWLYAEKDAADYDYQLALFPADVLTWVQGTQPDAWEVLTKNHGNSASQTLLNRLRDSLDQSGTLHVLRQGFDVLGNRSDSVFEPRIQPPIDSPIPKDATGIADRLTPVRHPRFGP